MSASSKPSPRYTVPYIVGFLVFAAFAAIGALNVLQSQSRTAQWPQAEARVMAVLELCEFQEKAHKKWVIRKVADCDEAKAWRADRQAFSAIRRTREFSFAEIEYDLDGATRQIRVRADLLGSPAPAEGAKITVHVDPDDGQRIARPFGRDDIRALIWTAVFGAIAGTFTTALGASIVYANARLGRERTRVLMGYMPRAGRQTQPLPARVTNGFGLAILMIGSLFAAATFMAALLAGNGVEMQGALIILAIAVGLWRVCKWLAERVFS